MHAYGHTRRDCRTCKYGCCVLKGNKHKNSHKVVDKARRKTARQEKIDEE